MDCQNLWCGSISPKTIMVLLKNFLKSGFDAVEYQSIVNLSRYRSLGYPLAILGSPLLGKGGWSLLSIVFWRCCIGAVFRRLVFYTSEDISLRPAAFLFLIYFIYKIWFGLVRFYGISTIVVYFMSNSVFTYTLDPIYQPLRLGRIWHKVNF